MNKSERDKLVLDNQRLVYYFYEQLKKSPLIENNKEDLISEGMIGLVKAAKCYEPDKGCKFATFAGRCITNQMLMYIRKLNKQNCEVSLYAPIGYDKDGNQLLLEDVLEDKRDIEEQGLCNIEFDRFIQKLTEKKRAILQAYSQGYTQKQIAEIVGLSQSYVSRIVAKLKKEFEKQAN